MGGRTGDRPVAAQAAPRRFGAPPVRSPARLRLLALLAAVLLTVSCVAPDAAEPFRGAGILPYPDGCGDVDELGLSWYYTWGYNSPCGSAAEFVPMMWGDWCADGSDCTEAPREVVASGAQTLLGFNEPDWYEQADLTVARALQLWAHLDATPLRLGSPAVTTGARGTAWLDAFMRGARERGLRVDFIAAHWYGEDCSSTDGLRAYLDELSRYGLPIWLTEFACEGMSAEVNQRFLRAAMAEIADVPDVERVAWFSNRPFPGYEGAALADDHGRLTALGRAYREIPAIRSV